MFGFDLIAIVSAIVALIMGWLGLKVRSATKRADKAEAEAKAERLRSLSLEERGNAQERAQAAARGVPKDAPPDPKRRNGLIERW